MTHRFHWIWPTLIVAAWCGPVLVGARASSPHIDTHELPLRTWFARAIHNGRVPEWNELDGTGSPSVARAEIAPYYLPHQVAYRLLRPATAWTWLWFVHTMAAALFARLCATGFGLRQWPATLAGIVYAGQGFFISQADRSWATTTACWLPLAIWATWRWLEQGGSRRALWLSGILALQLTAGHFQVAAMTHLCLLALAICHSLTRPAAARGPLSQRLSRFAGLGLAFFCALALAAAQWVPAAELAMEGDQRGRDGAFVSSHSAPPWQLATGHLAPFLLHHDPLWLASAWSPWQASPRETMGYVGILALGLSCLGAAAVKHDRLVRVWTGLLVISVLLSLGHHVPGYATWSQCPPLDWFPAPGRWNLVAGLFLAILAGKGLERLNAPRLGHWCQIFSLAAMATLALASWRAISAAAETDAFFDSPPESLHGALIDAGYSPAALMTAALTPATSMASLLLAGLAVPIGILALVGVIGMTLRPLRWCASHPHAIAILVSVELGLSGFFLRPFHFTWTDYEPRSESRLLKILARSATGARTTRVSTPLGRLPMAAGVPCFGSTTIPDIDFHWLSHRAGNVPSLHGWPDDWWPLPPVHRHDTLGVLLGHMPSRHTAEDLALMSWTDTRTLVAESQAPTPTASQAIRSQGDVEDPVVAGWRHGPRAGRLPGAGQFSVWQLDGQHISSRAWVIPLDPLQEPGTDPTLERHPPPTRRQMGTVPRPATLLEDEGEQVQVVASCDGPSLVLLADQFYPGWTASITRPGVAPRPVHVERAWDRFRLVRLPDSGNWTVSFRFNSKSHHVGRLISLYALAAWLVLAAYCRVTRRRLSSRLSGLDTADLQSATSPHHAAPTAPGTPS